MFAGMDSQGEESEDESDDNGTKPDESNVEQVNPGGDDWDKEWDRLVQPRRMVSVKPAKVKLLQKEGNLKGKAKQRVELSDEDSDSELDFSDSQSGGNVGEFCYHYILPFIIDFHHLAFDIPLVTQVVNQVTPKCTYKQGFLTIWSNISFEALHEKLATKFNVYPGSLKLQWSLDPKLETVSDLLSMEDLKDLIDRVRPLIILPLTAKGVPSKVAMKKISIYILNAAEPLADASNGFEPIGKVSEPETWQYHT